MTTIPGHELGSLIGCQLGPSDWVEITQEQVDGFANLTGDHQYIHTDPLRASQTPLGGTIAHGFFTLSLLSHFATSFTVSVEDTVMALNYGFEKVRFLSPVLVGTRIRAHATLADVVVRSPGQYLMTYDVTVEDEGEPKPALVARWLAMVVTQQDPP